MSLYSSPSVAKPKSSGGSSVCMAKATLHASLINELMRTKSTSGGKEIRGFTFIALMTSCRDERRSWFPSELQHFVHECCTAHMRRIILHWRWSEHHKGPGFWRCSPQLHLLDFPAQSEMWTVSFWLVAWTDGKPVWLSWRIPITGKQAIHTFPWIAADSRSNDQLCVHTALK